MIKMIRILTVFNASTKTDLNVKVVMYVYTIKQELCAMQVITPNEVANTETVTVKYEVNDQPVYLCCCYHLSVPVYKVADMISILCCYVEYITFQYQDAVKDTAGDMNQLDCSTLEYDCGLSQVVDKPTRGSVVLDKCLTNKPRLFTAVPVIDSVVQTDHKAVILKFCNC
jgi:hypothetical protein